MGALDDALNGMATPLELERAERAAEARAAERRRKEEAPFDRADQDIRDLLTDFASRMDGKGSCPLVKYGPVSSSTT